MIIKKAQLLRWTIRISFIALITSGLFTEFRPLSLILLIASLLFGNFFCGWICIFGIMQDIVSQISSVFIKKKLKVPYGTQKYLQFSRYTLAILLTLTLGREAGALPFNSYGTAIGILTGHAVEILAIISLIIFLFISIIFDRPFCNYICSEGIKFGITSFARIFSITRKEEKCTQCKKCDSACPMNIRISTINHVRNAQCINCFNCISSCPSKDSLRYEFVNIFKIAKEKLTRNNNIPN